MRQSQALVMTPQLMQAIKLLQLSNLDLAAYVEGELEKNPLLERAAEGEPGVIDGAAEPVGRTRGDASAGRSAAPATASTKAWKPAAAPSRSGSTPISKTNSPMTPARRAPRTGADAPAGPFRLGQRRQRRP